MNPLQSFWPNWSYGLPIGKYNHYRRRCVLTHTHSIQYWILGKHIAHEPPARHAHIMAGLSTCADAMPAASVPIRSGLIFTTHALGALLAYICQSTSRMISKYYFLIKLWIVPSRCTHPPGDGTEQSNLTQSITMNRPFYNPSRWSIRQVNRLGRNYKEI
jgi:hypothetical protein